MVQRSWCGCRNSSGHAEPAFRAVLHPSRCCKSAAILLEYARVAAGQRGSTMRARPRGEAMRVAGDQKHSQTLRTSIGRGEIRAACEHAALGAAAEAAECPKRRALAISGISSCSPSCASNVASVCIRWRNASIFRRRRAACTSTRSARSHSSTEVPRVEPLVSEGRGF